MPSHNLYFYPVSLMKQIRKLYFERIISLTSVLRVKEYGFHISNFLKWGRRRGLRFTFAGVQKLTLKIVNIKLEHKENLHVRDTSIGMVNCKIAPTFTKWLHAKQRTPRFVTEFTQIGKQMRNARSETQLWPWIKHDLHRVDCHEPHSHAV
jgi:hypothetical protein